MTFLVLGVIFALLVVRNLIRQARLRAEQHLATLQAPVLRRVRPETRILSLDEQYYKGRKYAPFN